MSTIPLKSRSPRDDLLRAAELLGAEDLKRFIADVLALRAQREGSVLAADETGLLREINRPLPDDRRSRLDELAERRREETLLPEEQSELIRLSDELEHCEANRLAALADLAMLRGVTLVTLMQELGIAAPPHD